MGSVFMGYERYLISPTTKTWPRAISKSINT